MGIMTIILETKRLILKQPTTTDFNDLLQLRTDHPVNDRSRRVMEKAGMSYHGMIDFKESTMPCCEIFNNKTNFDEIKLIPATLKEYPVIQNMGRFYVYDMSEFMGKDEGWEIPEDGLYECIDFNMAQFFVLRKFKNKGFGRYIAHQCFKKFPGEWEIMVILGNEGAYRFWRSTIKNYTNNNFTEYTRDLAHFNKSRKNIFKFDSRIVL